MSSVRKGNQNKKVALEPKVVSWQEKKSLADKEEQTLQKEIEDLRLWVGSFNSYSLLYLSNLK
jgi:DNA-directed RNA polymerase alpha subunit